MMIKINLKWEQYKRIIVKLIIISLQILQDAETKDCFLYRGYLKLLQRSNPK
jgi:hypothetical protein